MADNFTFIHDITQIWRHSNVTFIAQFVNNLYYKEYELWQVGGIKTNCLGVSTNIYRYTKL